MSRSTSTGGVARCRFAVSLSLSLLFLAALTMLAIFVTVPRHAGARSPSVRVIASHLAGRDALRLAQGRLSR